jgi:transcriptional regulator with XRE-family HTH domain
MAQMPALRHVLGQLRIEAGLSQVEMAQVLGCSPATVQKIEQAVLALSEEMAFKAQEALDISAKWLLANDRTKPPVTPDGILWNRFVYEFKQGLHLKRKEEENQILRQLKAAEKARAQREFDASTANEARDEIYAMLRGARGSPRHEIFLHRLQKKLQELKKDFPLDKKAFEELCQSGTEKTLEEKLKDDSN